MDISCFHQQNLGGCYRNLNCTTVAFIPPPRLRKIITRHAVYGVDQVKVLSRAQWRMGHPYLRFYSPWPRICECSESYSGVWFTGSSASLTFPLHSHMSSARREGSEYHFKSLWHDSAGARTTGPSLRLSGVDALSKSPPNFCVFLKLLPLWTS